MKILKVFFFFLLQKQFQYAVALNRDCNCTKGSTNLEVFQEHILKRRIRSVVFPNKAQLLLTPAFTKAILGGRPRGLSYSVEFDVYHPLPDTIEGWQPTLLLNKVKHEKEAEQAKAAAEAAAASAAVAHANDPKPKDAEVAADNTDDGDLDDMSFSNPLELHGNHIPESAYYVPDLSEYQGYSFPFENEEYDVNNWHRNNINSEEDRNPHYFTKYKENPHIRKLETLSHSHTKQFHKKPFLQKENTRKLVKSNEFNSNPSSSYEDNADMPAWHHDTNYRQRRELFQQLETMGSIYNINIKACIKRAMCEITTHLKPYGDSLMEDIVRIILTTPSRSADYYDEYAEKYDNVNCHRRFAVACPYRVLDFLTQNFRKNNQV